jgi:hypothetical protein
MPKGKSGAKDQGKGGFDGIRHAVDNFKDAPPPQRGPVIILAIVASVSLALALAFLAGDKAGYALVCFIGFAVLAGLTFYIFWSIAKSPPVPLPSPSPPLPASTDMVETWSRVVLASPLDGGAIDDLRKELESIRTNVFAVLQDLKQTGILLSDVRANIFLPDYHQAGDGYICWLAMQPRLRINMEGHPDENLLLRPGQGCTGKVFVEEWPHFGVTLERDDGGQEWDDVYQLTAEQKRQLHPDLRWIVSTPLNVTDPQRRTAKTAGVLNIDGLRHRLDATILRQVSAQILVAVGTNVQPKIEQLNKVRLVLGVKDKI